MPLPGSVKPRIKDIVRKNSRRKRPRAKSVDSVHSESESSAYEIGRNDSVSTMKNSVNHEDAAEENDEVTPLLYRKKARPLLYSRSFSLDSDPQYQFILFGTSCSFLTNGFSVSFVSSKQNSIVTIFAIWNTIIGSSLLAMPWSVERAGLGLALILMLTVSTLAVYTAYRLLNVQLHHGDKDVGDVPYLCKMLLGKWAEVISRISSFVTIFGANVVYWILMSNCLYHFVGYIVDTIQYPDEIQATQNETVLCSSTITASQTSLNDNPTIFQQIWNLNKTVPIWLVLLVAPLLNFRSPTFFTKFNSIGTLSVGYLLIFVIIKSVSWGINVDFTNTDSEHFVSLFKPSFFAASGMLPLSLFIHNIVITLMRNNRDQKHNSRDLSIAYILVVLTYLLIGFTFYICFPLKKSCIEDNMLNNFSSGDISTVIARIFLFFQLLTVFPLLSYMLRVQIFSALRYPSYPSIFHVIALNSVNIIGCILFAVFLPHIGTIIRFTGAICGFVYIFTLPCLLHLFSEKEKHALSYSSIFMHTLIPMIGFVNLVAQFFVSDST